jgi:polysaccharide export outer membrane protein
MIVSIILAFFFSQSCSTYSGTAIRKIEYQDSKISEVNGQDSGKKLEPAIRERTPESRVSEKENGKEKPAGLKEKTFIRMNAETVSIKDYHRARFPRNKVAFPDELKAVEKKYEYRIGADDVLHIFFWQHQDLTMDVTVRKDGEISFPLIGSIKAEGLTIPELENELKRGFGRFIQDPQININPKETPGQRIFIVGQVRKLYATIGGRPYFYLKTGSTLLDALSDVEFYTDVDLAASYITRDDLIIPVNLKTLLMDGDLTQNIPLMPEDKIVIPGPLKEITLLGEVGFPGRYRVNIDTTLVNALSIAKGINRETADLYMSFVARHKQILPVNLKRLLDYADISQDIIMEDGDIVYIPNIQEKKYYVLGEVNKPGVFYFRDPINVIEAVSQGGGFLTTAQRRQVIVVRGDIGNPQIYEIDALAMMEGKSLEKFTLQKGDIVYIPRTLIADWNVFLSQLFPSFQTVVLFDVLSRR